MFKCAEFIYIQMQKTASSHIAEVLMQLFDGQIIGKHNCASAKQIKITPYFIASMRNPWDWYLSLWTFGVGGRGGLWARLTRKNSLDLLRKIRQDPKNISQHWVNFLRKDTKKWQGVYQNRDDIATFRQWLALIHNPDNATELGEGYGSSDLSHQVGFMTYRYLYLHCCLNPQSQYSDLNNFTALKNFDAKYCYIDYFIRQENLESNFLAAIKPIKSLSKAEKSLIRNAKKTNVSVRKYQLADYYDPESIDLVLQHDRLLVEKFNYSPPE